MAERDSHNLQDLRAAVRDSGRAADCLDALGVVLTERGEYRRAAAYLRAAVAQRPEDSSNLYHLASALLGCGHSEEAAGCLERGLRGHPNQRQSWQLLGRIYLDYLHRPADAFRSYWRALQLAPWDMQSHESAARCCLLDFGPQEAIQRLRVSLPESTDPLNHERGVALALSFLGRYEEAVMVFRSLLSRYPDDPVSLNGMARVFTGLHLLAEAEYTLAWGIRRDENNRDLNLSYVLHLYRIGDVEGGRHFYRSRKHAMPLHLDLRSMPVWEGQDVRGKTLLLLTGDIYFGDALQFVRFARVAKTAGATVIAKGPKRIRPLLRTVPGVDVTLTHNDRSPKFDRVASAFSLSFILQTPWSELMGGTPYLSASACLRAEWRSRLRGSCLNVGIVWRGSSYHSQNHYAYRSMALERLRPLTEIPGVNIYSLQCGAGREELSDAYPAFNAADLAPDFPNAAAIISEIDLVVTVDTSIAHLAGALDKRTFLMLPYDACFRWMMDRIDTPWYPSMRLFRQTKPGEWSDVVAAVAAEVARLSAEKAAR